MNTSLVVGLMVGGAIVYVYHRAHAALTAQADRIERATRHPLAGHCQDCGGSTLTRSGICATCGSSAIWSPLAMALPPEPHPLPGSRAYIAAERRRDIAARIRARYADVDTEVIS